MYTKYFLSFLLLSCLSLSEVYGQCNSLRPQTAITFNTDQDCAPVQVTDFTITYFFNTPQNPADIEIRFEWNDPGNQISVINIGNGLIAANGDTEFTATAPLFTYFINDDCTLRPTSYIYINGVLCPTSAQEQTAFFWGTDEDGNGDLSISPTFYDICYNNPVTNAIFFDTSDFNCRIAVEPDNPNRQDRHVQFVYGTNHNPGSTILNLSLEDAGTQPLTDGTGNLATPMTRGTAGLLVTGGYFGPVENIPFPADGPVSITFPMNAPADPNNLIGNTFEITMFNWNTCNPYNGDPLNPNYDEAISTTAYIVIIDSPAPDFITRRGDASGAITTTFCLGEDIYFDNETPGLGGLDFDWEFYDDNVGSSLIGSSADDNPTFSFSSPGQKLIRLIAEDPTAQGSCIEIYEAYVNISPSLVAGIQLSDLFNNPVDPRFCQDAANSQNFDVRFRDNSVGSATANTRWRWEFYDENNSLIFEDPAAGAYSSVPLGPYDRVFNNPGIYRGILTIRDNATTCESIAEEFVYVYSSPVADFDASDVCEGELVSFLDMSSIAPINGESIVAWEWDFSYDGVTFTKDPVYDNQTSFDYDFVTPGSYDVALQVLTDQNSCSDLIVKTITVNPPPVSQITPDVTEGCSIFTVNFTNDFVGIQPDVIDQYIWEVDNGGGFQVDSIQSPTDPGFSNTLTMMFENTTQTNVIYSVRLTSVTVDGCQTVSAPVDITVFPAPLSGFNTINYSPFNDNCSPMDINFVVDNQTQNQSPTNYSWTVSDASGTLDVISTGVTPSFSYTFENLTQSIKDYSILLTTTLPGSCTNDSSITVRVNPIPMADFDIDTVAVTCDDILLNFDALQKGLAEYKWTLKVNGTTLFSSNTEGDNFDYLVNKTTSILDLEVELITTNFAGCQSLMSSQTIQIEAQQQINVDFDVTPNNQTLPDATVFLTNNTNSGPWSYSWDFGDGNTSTDPNISEHTYADAGTYSISLTAFTGTCVEVTVKSITINPIPPNPPIVDFDYNPSSGCAPLTVQFTNLSQFTDDTSYQWNFGAGQGTSTSINPSYTYFEPGIYTVSLTAANSVGQTDTETKTQIIEVFETPIAQFDVRPNIVFVPDNPIYTNNNSQRATSFFWDFGDGGTSTESEPVYYYKEEGTYDITLIASNINGCADTLRREGIVEGQMNGRFLVPNAFTPNLSGPVSGDASGQIGTNDIFLPLTQGVAEFEMFIFNRWGEMLFKSKDKTIGWDGYYNGKLCPQDVYIYKVNLVFENGRKITRNGDVNLIR